MHVRRLVENGNRWVYVANHIGGGTGRWHKGYWWLMTRQLFRICWKLFLGRKAIRSPGRQAAKRLSSLAAEDFDLVITDLHMGKISRLAVIAATTKQNSPDTITFMITGCCLPSQALSMSGLLECTHVHKPDRFYPCCSTVESAGKRLERCQHNLQGVKSFTAQVSGGVFYSRLQRNRDALL